jgi:branched-chain amino acid transport system permease protein
MSSFFLSLITNVGITLMGVLSVYLITGLTGIFSMGQASFMSIGAYSSGILAVKLGWHFIPCALFGIAIGAIFGLIIGLPTLKLRRDYIGLITIGFGNAIVALLNNMVTLTGGANGLVRIPKRTTIYMVWISVAVLIFFIWNFKKSKFGRQCMALKTDELAAKGMGINVAGHKLLVFVIASIISSYAGVLYGFFTTYVEPSIFAMDRTVQWLIMVFFGGVGSLTGSILASVFLQTLMEVLRSVQAMRIVVYCLIVLFIINFRPQGLFGTYEFSITRLLRRISRKNEPLVKNKKITINPKTDGEN